MAKWKELPDLIPRAEANAMVAAAYQAAADLIGRPDIDLEDVLGTQKAIIALTPDDAREAEADVIRAAVAAALTDVITWYEKDARTNRSKLESLRDWLDDYEKGSLWGAAVTSERAVSAIRALIDAPADAALNQMLAEERAKGMEEAGRCPQCEARENAFLEIIRIKQECRHCGYQSIKWLGENAACPMLDCHGGMVAVPNRAAEVREKNDE